ncbi:DUF6931 family protein [Blastopirellula marina]|uniref:Uncharacterized protein n=1 Tax=Blastopirellula marina DSM 3645 TaxID=314230 RepID=A3ZN27_9BACT|nr:hypothetical protein [Blastopirellula marina]EAQ82356.1 hypothetical protein DSM3645_01540 [Blastopirellula marina DSM 3645]
MSNQEAAAPAAFCDLSEPAQALLKQEPQGPRFFKSLMDGELYDDALQFAAACLAGPDRIWWGVLCVWESLRPVAHPDDEELLERIVTYLQKPQDELRWQIRRQSHTRGISPTLKMLAEALFHSGDSITPPDGPQLKPNPCVPVALVSTAAKSAATICRMQRGIDMRPEFLRLAMEVSQGKQSLHVEPAEALTK